MDNLKTIKTLKIILTSIFLISILVVLTWGIGKSETSVYTVSRNEMITEKVNSLNNLKAEKENCLNSLSYTQSLLHKEGQITDCNEKDGEIEKLGNEVSLLLTYEYEKFEERKEEKPEREPGKLTEDGDHQEMPETVGTTSHERFKEISKAYGLDAGLIRETENHYGLTEGMILCIAIAETSGGKFGAGKGNIGNVGNNDRGDRVTYSNIGASLDRIGATLNNGYLGSKKTLACLSNAGNCKEPNDNGKRYATSEGNWEKNMIACLSSIYGNVDSQFLVHNRQ